MDSKPEIFYEIEIKSVFNADKYQEIKTLLETDPRFRLFNEDSIHTLFYKDKTGNDIRLRNSDKIIEFVYKKGLVTKYCRKEVKIPLENLEQINHFVQVFDHLPLEKQRGTLKHKKEYWFNYQGFDYCVCLQFIEDFAHIVEVEYLAEKEEESDLHIPNILEIMKILNLQVIDGEKFMARVFDYINGANTLNYE
jgi:adenylate cyclase class IV